MEQPGKRVADSRVTLSAMMRPKDTNSRGNVHGGVIMKMVDEAAGLAAMRHACRPVGFIVNVSQSIAPPAEPDEGSGRSTIGCGAGDAIDGQPARVW